MRTGLSLLPAATVALAGMLASSAQAASPMSSTTIGAGPHGYDFLIGTWSCKNSMPTELGGPAATTVTIGRLGTGSYTVHVTGANFDALGYTVYVAKTKTWWNPSATASGGYGTESSQQTGKKTVWSGPFTDASGKTVQQRDTYTWTNAGSFTDLYQVNVGGTWKTEGNTICTKT